MKDVSIAEFNEASKDYDTGRKTPFSNRALNLVRHFIEQGADIIEVEASDFDNELDFSNKMDITRASNYIRNILLRNEFKYEGICVKRRGLRLFIGRRDAFEGR